MILTALNNAEQTIYIDANLIPKTANSRFISALKKFGLLFLFATGSILIPVAHFVLVPAFLIASIVTFIKEIKIKNILVVNNEYQCLKCKNKLIMPKSLNSDLRLDCKNCYQQYKVTI